MKLYETFINKMKIWQEIQDLQESDLNVPEETLNNLLTELQAVELDHAHKALSVAKVVKGCYAESDAIKVEIDKLTKRMKSLNKTAESLEKYLTDFCDKGQKYSDPTTVISWRKSTVVEVDEASLPDAWWKEELVRTVDKTGIKLALKEGNSIKGAKLVEKQNIQIK